MAPRARAAQCWEAARSCGCCFVFHTSFFFLICLFFEPTCWVTCLEQKQDRCHYSEALPGFVSCSCWLSLSLPNFLHRYLCDGIGLVTGVIFEILMQSMWVSVLAVYLNVKSRKLSWWKEGGQHAITRHLPQLLFPANVFEFLTVKYSQLPLHAWLRRHFLRVITVDGK